MGARGGREAVALCLKTFPTSAVRPLEGVVKCESLSDEGRKGFEGCVQDPLGPSVEEEELAARPDLREVSGVDNDRLEVGGL